jgi:hypothetical protein
MLLALAAIGALAAFSWWLQQLTLPYGWLLALKVLVAIALCASVYRFYSNEGN